MTTTLDIAALVSAIIWPLALIILFLVYRENLGVWIKQILPRINKLGIGSFSLELAEAKAYAPQWVASSSMVDLRQRGVAGMDVTDSTAGNFAQLLDDDRAADFAEVDLGEGHEWLSSRLYIMSILFARMKGIRSLLFLESSAGVRRKVIGMARPEHVRWSLAQRYPWFEEAYTDALSQVFGPGQARVLSRTGRIGEPQDPKNASKAVTLLQDFLQRIQAQGPAAPVAAQSADPEWVEINATMKTREHALWSNARDLEDLLGNVLDRTPIRSSAFRDKPAIEQIALIAEHQGPFVALVQDDGRLDRVIDKERILRQAMQSIATTMKQN